MYVNFNENPRGNYYAGDCVIRAINIVTGISWDEIYTALCAEGFYLGDWGMTPSERRRMSNRSMVNNRMYNRTRTSYNNFYGNDAKMDFMADLESLMNKAPDEHTRMKVERMLNDLR